MQTPGSQTADTKLDLVVDPGGMLYRSLSMWDALGAFGQVGNQSYGYLWPMGPVFWAGQLLELPGWVTQRLWLALVLVVAFLGFARLLRALGVRQDLAIILGALAYALSPRMITTVGPISIEAWPSALAPWVLLALVLGSRQGSPRRYALGAALGVGMVGGVNAAATFAVIPLGAIWLLTRSRGPRRRALMIYWPIFTVLCCLWWVVPLAVLGRYSPPFLDYIETASLTTYPTTVFDSLRGTSAWIPYLEARWRAGSDLITTPLLIQHSTVVLMLGFIGLTRRDNPHRVFAAAGLAVGVLMVTFGHTADIEGWFAAEQRSLLDGALAPFRNVHKFDPVIRIPLVLGLAHLTDVILTAWTARQDSEAGARSTSRWRSFGARANSLAVVWLAVIAVAGAAQPAWTGRLAPAEAFTGVPDYWLQATSWLAEADPDARSLLLPGSQFGTYVWGTPQDEPIQPLADAPWAVRNAIPLAPVGNIRALDALEERLDRGLGSEGLADYLRRLGVRYLVVRNDLERSDDVVDPVLVHQTLASTPGIVLAKAFGPLVGGEPKIVRGGATVSINQGWQDQYQTIEVFEVMGAEAPVVGTSELPIVVGDPESLLELSEQGVLDSQPTVLAHDADADATSDGPLILTDGMRLRERYFANLHDGSSWTLTSQEARAIKDLRDYEVTSDPDWFTRAELEGAREIIASSSLAEASTLGGSQPSRLPYAAFDGDPLTAWVSRTDTESAPSLRLVLDDEVDPRSVRITLGEAPRTLSEIRVRTEAGTSAPLVAGAQETVDITLPAGPTSWIQVEDAEGRTDRQLSIAELRVPGVSVTRWLVPPEVPDTWAAPDVISFSARADLRTGCALIDESVRCRPGFTDEGEEASGMRRRVTLPEMGRYEPLLTVVPRPGAAIPALLQEGQLVSVGASSRSTAGASVSSAVAAFDGIEGTTWISAWVDDAPSLEASWLVSRRVSAIAISLDPTAAALMPTLVTVTYPGGSQTVKVIDGRARLRPISTKSLSVRINNSESGGNLDFDGTGSPLGVGVSELSIEGVPFARIDVSAQAKNYRCGSGPEFVVNGQTFRTAIVGSPMAIHLGQPVAARVCGGSELSLSPGENRLELGATTSFRPVSILLSRNDSAGLDISTPATRSGSSYTFDGDVLALRHNANPGWTASADGRSAKPVVLDGWQQGFEAIEGEDNLRTAFAPETAYRTGLAVGGLLFLGCIVLYFWWRRKPALDDAEPLAVSPLAGPSAALGIVVSGGLIAGWWGFLVVVTALMVLLPLMQRRTELAQLIALTPLVLVGLWNSFHPWGGTGTWGGSYGFTQLLLVVPLTLVAAGVAAPSERSRASGRSSTR